MTAANSADGAHDEADSPVRDDGGRWLPGQSGNPAGRMKGQRHKVTLAIEKLLDDDAETITRKAIEMAKAGDLAAMRLCMDRLCAPRKDRHVTFALPAIETAGDAVKASAALVAAVAEGELTPSEAGELAKVVEGYVRSLEARDLEARLVRLEAAAVTR